MKIITAIISVMLLMGTVDAQTVTIDLSIKNELTGKPVDATLEGLPPENIKRMDVGAYRITIPSGKKEVLSITRDGYFDYDLSLEYPEGKLADKLEIKLKPVVPQLIITVVNDETNETLTTSIDLFTMDESSIVFSDTVEVAPYTIDLEYNKVHVLQVRRPGFFSYKDTINYRGVFDGRARTRLIRLVPIKEGNKISLQNIYFKPNESELTDFAKLMLAEFTHILDRDKGMIIEISAHTDDVGTNEYNQTLSEKRANSVKKYLVEKGAAEKQLLTKGYGETTPLQPNDSDKNRALNRRVEFKIIKAK